MTQAPALALAVAALAFVCGVAAYYLVRAVRALPYILALTDRGVKPWACDTCMSLWASLACTLVSLPGWALGPTPEPFATLSAALLTWGCSAVVCLALIRALADPVPPGLG